MGKKETLLEWADEQADWARDALRRHAESPQFGLSEFDKAAILDRVRYSAGIKQDVNPLHIPISAKHLPFGVPAGARALLCSLGPVENLGRLASEQRLAFALDGITLIYGDNGSGKSCYCRITKKICRSLTTEELLGNVFEPGEKPPANVIVRYRVEGTEQISEECWVDGTPPPEAVRSISVFDSRNARLYIDKQNRLGFLPAEIALLESHGKWRCEMDQIFQLEKKVLETRLKVKLPAGFTAHGSAAQIVAKLELRKPDLPTIDELEQLGSWSAEDQVIMSKLENSLAQDPAALTARSERAASAMNALVAMLHTVESELSDPIAQHLQLKARNAAMAESAVVLAAGDAFENEPLAGIGKEPWRLMYDYARAYISTIRDDGELPSAVGDLCALCLEPLSSEASNRLSRFREFATGEATKNASIAKAELEKATGDLRAVAIPDTNIIGQSLAEYGSMHDLRGVLVARFMAYLEAAKVRKACLLKAAVDGNFANVRSLPEAISSLAEAEVSALLEEVKAHSDMARLDASRDEQVAHLNALKDQKLFYNALPTILERHADLEQYSKITHCITLVGTQQLSTFLTKTRRRLITEDLDKRLKAEISFLNLDHVPFKLSDQSKDGHSYFEVGINAAVNVTNEKVLSEGEQRALGLACFLAEVGADTANHGLIIDDPVSSLDHLRIRRVAERLVSEAAKGKQVIIFTHSLVFHNEVFNAAAAANPPVPTARRVITKSKTAGFGLISNEEGPWAARKVNDRIKHLRDLLKEVAIISDRNTDKYRSTAKVFYTDLRETWERLVEELLLGKVVERYHSDVRTQSLKSVTVTDEDYRTVYWAMKRVSELSGHDMAAGKQVPIPSPEQMKDDLRAIENYKMQVVDRAKTLNEGRKALEKPPAAKVA